jgi:8-oxo-dGTP pyrophosphatase MutT (NUDIX family)
MSPSHLVDEHNSQSPETTTAYRRDALLDTYGQIDIERDTFTVQAEKYERMQTAKENDAIGGARVLLEHPEESETLLVSNRGEEGWDIPGGAREPGETPEETASREVVEEVGLPVNLGEPLQMFDWGFGPESGDCERVGGLWIHFEGVVASDDTTITVQEVELLEAEWFDTPPANVDPPAEPIVEASFSE